MTDASIRVTNLCKCYAVYDRPADRLKQAILPRLRQPFRPLLGKHFKSPNYYREFWALRPASFEIGRGETVGIIGRNGSGKSTLLQMICGTLAPTRGELKVTGRVAALLELGAGFNAEFTGRENVYLNASILGLSKSETDDKLPAILAFADIGEFIDQPVKTYSSGMFVRLAFAVIAHVDADILIIDEALSVGDIFFTQKCMRFLRNFQKQGTILFVSHDTASVTNLCQRVIWLDSGEVRGIGEAKTITERYLQSYYEAEQGPSAETMPPTPMADALIESAPTEPTVQAHDFGSEPDPLGGVPTMNGFGKGGLVITRTRLLDSAGDPVYCLKGGERVSLVIEAMARQPIQRLLVGFYIRDRLGQILFGDNTHQAYINNPIGIESGYGMTSHFQFDMPVLAMGDYVITVAVGEGTQDDHVIHHWIHDALAFKSLTKVPNGLLGVAISVVELTVSGCLPRPAV